MKKKRFNLGFGQTKRLALLAAAVYFTALVPYVLGGTSLAGLSPSMQGMSPQQGAPRPPVVAPQSKTPSEAPRQAARDEAKKHKREQVPGDRQHAVQADLPNELDRAQVCIIEYQDQQVQRALGSPGGVSRVAFQSIRKDIADIRGQLNLPPEPPVDAAPCDPRRTRHYRAPLWTHYKRRSMMSQSFGISMLLQKRPSARTAPINWISPGVPCFRRLSPCSLPGRNQQLRKLERPSYPSNGALVLPFSRNPFPNCKNWQCRSN